MTTPNTDNLTFYPRLRLAWIERRARRTGTIGRPDIIEAFGISKPQASADLQAYLALNPGSLVYDLSAQRYRWQGGDLIIPLPAALGEFCES